MPLRSMKLVRPIDLSTPSMKHIIFLVLSLDSSLNDVKMRLAGIYEVLHEPRKALDLVYQGMLWTSVLNGCYISGAFQ
jgi:hypothetical protein